MAGAVAVQLAREEVFENFHTGDSSSVAGASSAAAGDELCHPPLVAASILAPCSVEARGEAEMSACDDRPVAEAPTEVAGHDSMARCVAAEEGPRGPITVTRHSRLAPYKPGKMTVVLDMDECLLHSKFHGPGAASEAYRQSEDRPDAVNEVNSFWVALDDGDTAQVNKRPGLDPFLEALARDYNTIVFTAAMPDYAGPVLDYIDPKGTLFHRRLYRSSCRQVKGAFLKDLSVLGIESTDMSRTVLVDNNPLSFICQPTNGVLVASFYDDPNDTALTSVMQLIRHLDRAGDVRPILKDMFRLDVLLGDYRTALFDDNDEEDEEEDEEEAFLESSLEEGTGECRASVVANASAGELLVVVAEKEEAVEEKASCLFQGGDVDCSGGGLRDDDDESVKTEACSEGSGESSLGEESLTSREEMELELEF